MAMGERTAMLTDRALLTLTQWLSPAYPIGAFAYSHGLEWAVEARDVTDAETFRQWLLGVLSHGAGRDDALLLSAAHAAGDDAALIEIDGLARAICPSRERLMETVLQGEAFARTTGDIWPAPLPELTYPVAVGAAARMLGLPLRQTLILYLHAFAANLTAAAIRLVPLGQTEGHSVLAEAGPLCAEIAGCVDDQTLDDLGSISFLADIASMKHETQYTRLFRS